jgi:hypothetical protein
MSLWDIASVSVGSDQITVSYLGISGTEHSVKSATLVGSIDEGAVKLMNEGFEPFGVGGNFPFPAGNLWFRHEVKELPWLKWPSVPIKWPFKRQG